MEKFIYNEVYQKYTMEVTTIKLYKTTKAMLDSFKQKNESYDDIITRILSYFKNKNLKKELIEAYSNMGKEDLKILGEWENASGEVE